MPKGNGSSYALLFNKAMERASVGFYCIYTTFDFPSHGLAFFAVSVNTGEGCEVLAGAAL